MFKNYLIINYLPKKTMNPIYSFKQFLLSIFNLQKATIFKAFLSFLLFLPIAQNNFFAQSYSRTEYLITSYGYATGVVDENEMINPSEALNEPDLIPNKINFYTKFDNVSNDLVLDLGIKIYVGITIIQYINI